MENNKDVKRITEELADKGCAKIKDKDNQEINVCVGTRQDMGKRTATIISDKKTEI